MKTKEKAIRSLVGILIAIVLLFSSGLKLPVLDTTTDVYFRDAITKAGVAYATCRVINASVSIIKESSLQLEPAGVGISLALGQALDPIDDMIERLSGVIVTAITSLGVQKLAYEISVSIAPTLMALCLFALSILIWSENARLASLQKLTMQILLLLVVARFCLPLSSMANEYVQKHYFDEQISAANNELALGSAELDKLKDFTLPEIDGFLGTIENSASFVKLKSIMFKNALVNTVSNMGAIIENLLKLMFLYVGIFVIQVIVLPLLSFWFLIKTANSLFHKNVSLILHPAHKSKHSNVEQGISSDS